MNLNELKKICSAWDKSSEAFAPIVAATASLGLYQRELAEEFEVAESTVSRWARGLARPHPRMQKLIVDAIEKRVQSALNAQKRNTAGAKRPLVVARSR
jgi:transcriptional regulator with XRE-family HTH domain